MDPSEAPIPPQWISIFSNSYLLGFSLLLSLCLISLMVFVLRGRSCHDWYLALFTTLAFFNLLMLFPFVQSSQLAPGEISDQFIDIDRPWLLILTYGFTAFILIASTTSMEYIVIFLKPSWKERWWVTVLRLFTTFVSLSLPLIDVAIEWSKEEASTHCLENVCRWFLIRKDASLCILLLLWSLSVCITLISANLDRFLLLPQQLALWRNSKKPVAAMGEEESESAQEYRRQLMIERQRAAEIIEQRAHRQSEGLREERRGERVPLTTPHIPLTVVQPQSHTPMDTDQSHSPTAPIDPDLPVYSAVDPLPCSPYPTTTETSLSYPSTSGTGLPYPPTIHTGLPYPSTVEPGVPYPSNVDSVLPYPQTSGTVLPYPSTADSGVPYPLSMDAGPPYPNHEHPRATRHSSLAVPPGVKRRVSAGSLSVGLTGRDHPVRGKGRRPSHM